MPFGPCESCGAGPVLLEDYDGKCSSCWSLNGLDEAEKPLARDINLVEALLHPIADIERVGELMSASRNKELQTFLKKFLKKHKPK